MAESRPPLSAELIWPDHLRFSAVSGSHAFLVDGDGAAGPTPVQLAALGLAGCLAADVVAILEKGRHGLTALRVSLSSERAEESPRRFVRIAIQFHLSGPVPREAVERAIAMSRDTCCSVWHSMRPDIELVTSADVQP